MKECWVDKEGLVHEGDNHQHIASLLFPNSNNPELSCEKAGYVKLGTQFSGSPMMENYDPNYAEQAQINTVTYLWEEHYRKANRVGGNNG